MKLKTATWNIGGGKLLTPGADPSRMTSYGVDGIEEIARIIRESGADIVALQEVQQKDGYDQIELIARLAGYDYFFHDSTSESHIDKDCQLGHGILSKYPISKHRFGLFRNPELEVAWEDGTIARSFDKGFSVCDIVIDDVAVTVATLHLLPFGRFGVELDSPAAREIFADVSSALQLDDKNVSLVMGDFNINGSRVGKYFPDLFGKNESSEVTVSQPTIPNGGAYDHVLYRGLSLENMQINSSVKTDHYPVICDFLISK